jgi:hypothetical protein
VIELYVYSEGNKPVEVVLGRFQAVKRLCSESFPTTAAERKAISAFLEGNVCELGRGIGLVGCPPEVPDRKLTRVTGAFGANS